MWPRPFAVAMVRTMREMLRTAELREPDVRFQQDYRLAVLILMLAAEGKRNPYSKVFYQLFHKPAHQVRFWWRDRKKLLWLAEATNCPTPLLVANRVEEVFNVIPDYDRTLKRDQEQSTAAD